MLALKMLLHCMYYYTDMCGPMLLSWLHCIAVHKKLKPLSLTLNIHLFYSQDIGNLNLLHYVVIDLCGLNVVKEVM